MQFPSTNMPERPRVAMVCSYGNNCGMSTYAGYLTAAMRPLVEDICIFAEYIDDVEPEDGVVRCWDRAKGNYAGILPEVMSYKPDVVFVQHEYGQMNNPIAWNMLIGHLSSLFRTVVVLHSIYDHKDKLIFEAPCNEIIVHSLSGRDLLLQKGIAHAPIHYIPHGCIPPKDMDLKWSATNNKPIIFQFGFGFEYKGWSNVNDVVKELKGDFPDVTYMGVFNVSKFCAPRQTLYHASLMKDIRDAGLQDNIVLHRGFRSEEVIFSYMMQAKVNLFPYWNHHEWLVHGASGAVRLALASGTPTIVGDVPFFGEFEGYLPVCSSAEEYVYEITKILKDEAYRDEIKQSMRDFIEERSWDKVAKWYLACRPDAPFDAPIGE